MVQFSKISSIDPMDIRRFCQTTWEIIKMDEKTIRTLKFLFIIIFHFIASRDRKSYYIHVYYCTPQCVTIKTSIILCTRIQTHFQILHDTSRDSELTHKRHLNKYSYLFYERIDHEYNKLIILLRLEFQKLFFSICTAI